MGSISLLQWRKAYMLEFLEGGEVKDCFTFSVPPESEELQFSQRITETKTFGGSVFDDYGNDSYKITLSGSTINEDKKFIYKGGKKVPQYLTGTKEIFELQKIIKNWADDNYAEGFFRKATGKLEKSDKKVMLYDLSKMSVLQIATGTASRNYWRVFIKDLKIKRDKSKPKTYNYTLEMIGVEDNSKSNGGLFSALADVVNSIQGVVDNIQTIMDLTEASMAAVSEVAYCCADVKKAFQTLETRKNNGSLTGGLVALNIASGFDVVSRIMGGDSNSFYNSTKNLLSACTTFGGLGKSEEKSGKTQNTSKFKVTFDSNGGSNVQTQTVEYCKTATKPENPTKEKYTFAGWFDKSLETEYDFTKEITEDITLYAKWNLAIATITYNSRNGSRVASQEVKIGDKTTPPTPPTRDGYIFDKWCTDYEGTTEFNFDTVIIGDITLYAAWRKVCNIVFNTNGGSTVDNQIVSIGSLAVYPKTPTKENFTFAYWCTDEELENVFDFSTPVTVDITLYAKWVQISNTVTFNSNGGTEVASQRVPINGYASKPAAPTKTGYDFIYWCTDKDLTNEFKFNTTKVNSNITLYAKWNESIYSVVFDSVGGSEVPTQGIKYNQKAVFPPIPVKENASFELWQTRKEIKVDSGEIDESNNPIMNTEYEYEEFDFNTPIKEDVTLYARWFGGE